MTERTLRSQFVKEVLSTPKFFGGKIAILEQTGPTPRNFAFSQQGNAPFLNVRMREVLTHSELLLFLLRQGTASTWQIL